MQTLSMETIRSDIESLDKKIARLKASLQSVERERAAMALVVERYSEKPQKRSSRRVNLRIDPDDIRGLELEVALVHIADVNDGELPSTLVREILERAGILTRTKKENSRELWNFLQSSELFEKAEKRGAYTLVSHAVDRNVGRDLH